MKIANIGYSHCRCTVRLTVTLEFFFFFNDTATTEIYTLSLHDALPICGIGQLRIEHDHDDRAQLEDQEAGLASDAVDRKSTRLNSSHLVISYAVFCLKKKKKN